VLSVNITFGVRYFNTTWTN